MTRTCCALIVGLVACAPDAPPADAPSTSAADGAGASAQSVIPALPRVGPMAVDSGPGIRVDRASGGVRVVMQPNPGDQINALQPPVITTTDGRRLQFGGTAVTADSAYFVGDVTLGVRAEALPVEGTLTTSYCRAGESLCRSAKRPVSIR